MISDILDIVFSVTVRGRTKEALIERLKGRLVPQTRIPNNDTITTKSKNKYKQAWLDDLIEDDFSDRELNYCMDALMSLNDSDIIQNERSIKKNLLKLYKAYYESASSTLAGNIRKAICRIDEAINAGNDVM